MQGHKKSNDWPDRVFDLDEQTASSSFFANHKPPWINGNALCAIISFIDPNKSIRQLKHVVSKAA